VEQVVELQMVAEVVEVVEQVDLELVSISVCGATAYPITIGAGGAGGTTTGAEVASGSALQYFQQLHQQVVEVE
jgi:DNA-binding transcriptional regulator LsrR (DeoR family)